jgi:hypothetical protein
MNIRTRIVKVAAALTLSATAVGIVAISPAGAAAGDPSQWGRARAEVAKVNEYEGQQHKHVNEYEGQKVYEYAGQHR